MGNNEDYLDSLLRAAMEPVQKDIVPENSELSDLEKTDASEAQDEVKEPEISETQDEVKEPDVSEMQDILKEQERSEAQSTLEESDVSDEQETSIEQIQTEEQSLQAEPFAKNQGGVEQVAETQSEEEENPTEQTAGTQDEAEQNRAEQATEPRSEAVQDVTENADNNIKDEIPDDDPNKAMSADEIAKMFAEMERDMEMIRDNDAQISLTEEENKSNEENDLPEEEKEIPDLMAAGEMEIDLNAVDNMDNIDAILGLKETVPKGNEKGNPEGQNLNDLLDFMGDDDGELAEINELLKKSDNNELVDDDEMLAMLEGYSDSIEKAQKSDPSAESAKAGDSEKEEQEEKPKKKRWGRKKKKKEENGEQPEEAGGTGTEGENNEEIKEKKEGFFGKLLRALTEEVEEESPEEDGQEQDLLKEKKKDKKAKKKKGKKNSESDEGNLEEGDPGDAGNGKGKKKKKPKKEKKAKKEKAPVIEEPGKKLPKKMVIRIFVLCFSFMAAILLIIFLLPGLVQLSSARKNFYAGNYDEAYQELIGQNLNKSDEILLQKAEILAQLERKADSYKAYKQAGAEAEALNALLEGMAFYRKNEGKCEELGISDDADEAYRKLVLTLESDYSIKEEQALEVIALDSIDYTYEIYRLVGKTTEAGTGNDDQSQEDDQSTDDQPEDVKQESAEESGQEETLEDPLDAEVE